MRDGYLTPSSGGQEEARVLAPRKKTLFLPNSHKITRATRMASLGTTCAWKWSHRSEAIGPLSCKPEDTDSLGVCPGTSELLDSVACTSPPFREPPSPEGLSAPPPRASLPERSWQPLRSSSSVRIATATSLLPALAPGPRQPSSCFPSFARRLACGPRPLSSAGTDAWKREPGYETPNRCPRPWPSPAWAARQVAGRCTGKPSW